MTCMLSSCPNFGCLKDSLLQMHCCKFTVASALLQDNGILNPEGDVYCSRQLDSWLILFLLPAALWGTLTGSVTGTKVFQFIYFFSSFWNQFGPNCTTFLVAGRRLLCMLCTFCMPCCLLFQNHGSCYTAACQVLLQLQGDMDNLVGI